MATYNEKLTSIDRELKYVLEMHLDQCTLENGIAPCTATQPCHFTWVTCKDKNNYTLGTKIYRFNTRGTRIPGSLPYLSDDFTFFPAKISSRRWRIEKAEMQFNLVDDLALSLANLDKSTTQAEDLNLPGTYWARMMARNPNTKGRMAKLYQGFDDVPFTSWELKFQGLIDDIDWNDRGIRIVVRDMLYKLTETKVPTKVSSDNVLMADYNGGSIMYVRSAGAFDDASTQEPGAVLVENEIVLYTGKNIPSNQLTGCYAGAYATTQTLHSAGKKVQQIVCFGDFDYNGVSADHIFMMLLYYYGELPLETLTVVDYGKTLGANITNVATTIPITGGSVGLPRRGVIRIGDELIFYHNNDGTNLYAGSPWHPGIGNGRGLYKTSAAPHTSGDPVYFSTFTEQINQWTIGREFRAKVKSSKSINDLMAYLMQDTMMDIWQAENSKIVSRIQAPPIGGTIPIYDATIMVLDSKKVSRNEDERYTRTEVYYSAGKIDPSENEEDYDELAVYVGAVEESIVFYGEAKPLTLFSRFIYRDADGEWLADHVWSKYKEGATLAFFDSELYKDKELQLGDLIKLRIRNIVDEDGNYLVRIYRIISKKQYGDNLIEYQVQDTGFADVRYSRIGPKNGVLDLGMTAVQLTMDIDLNATTLEFANWRSGSLHSAKVVTSGASEMINYTGVTDLGGGKIRLTGLTRDADGLAGGGQIHNAGDYVIMLYSAASNGIREEYGFYGSSPDNLLDSDGDFVGDVDGYYIW